MEESIREAFSLKSPVPGREGSLNLAYLGDAVQSLLVRTVVLERGSGKVAQLNKATLPYVSAVGQAKMTEAVMPLLTEEETAVYRRGRNAHTESRSKNASDREYHKATGLEALWGWLYLKGETERLIQLMKAGMDHVDGNAD